MNSKKYQTTNIIKIISTDIFLQFISEENYGISFLCIGLDSRNGTYSSLAFISGVGNKNPPTGCGITAFLKSDKKCHLKKKYITKIGYITPTSKSQTNVCALFNERTH